MSSLVAERMVIKPGIAPPAPRLTVTRQRPVYSGESEKSPSESGSELRWTPSTGFLRSCFSVPPAPRPSDHWSVTALLWPPS